MECLISLLESAEYRERIITTWLLHWDGLEPAFEGSVFFDILTVFCEGCRTDDLHSTTGERWLQQISCIAGTLTSSSTDDSMELIDEEDDFSFGFFYLIDNSLESLLELSTIARSCYK